MKNRTESKELKTFRYLRNRMDLEEKDEKYYHNLEQGYLGECQFDNWLNRLNSSKPIILNDLLLEQNNTQFQIDSSLIERRNLHIFEIKNFQGDFFIEGDQWFNRIGSEIKNPLHQLRRAESLLRQFLQPLSLNLTIEPHIIFINPQFYLYHATPDLPIIFYPQLERFFRTLKVTSSNNQRNSVKVANYLLSHHIEDSVFSRVPSYSFEELRKGVVCEWCKQFLTVNSKNTLVCRTCDNVEKVDAGVLRNIIEYKTLFPNAKVTTNSIFQFCQVVSKRSIRRILLNNHQRMGLGRDAFYL
ncbi:nuclease-related domain-containing protein [Aquibacillus rhizosphaerae]|uniref:NERD domain-containing protein n=1 Tax=Aquibacillus rhizosphaerae TaxID=3051431 RepID=A0ABT7L0K4_9BACI|nr:NERD domain-containing protein [Aquibacillus sp. LR5S19]MDL4839366.1 NERD domain-containing protein [Aquibacillus sp. LR5S19]